jgi:hypothetical protein
MRGEAKSFGRSSIMQCGALRFGLQGSVSRKAGHLLGKHWIAASYQRPLDSIFKLAVPLGQLPRYLT